LKVLAKLSTFFEQANGNEYFELNPYGLYPPQYWTDRYGGYSGYGYGDNGRYLGGYRNNNGFYDDLLANRNGYDLGKTNGGKSDIIFVVKKKTDYNK
jgi:hypothetical protein